MTASRAIKTPEAVSAELRSRVEKAVLLLNYHPNLNARALASGRTEVLGVIVPSLTQHIFTDVLRGIYDGVEGTQLLIQLGNSFYSLAEEERLIGQVLRQKPSAVILSGVNQTGQSRRMLAQANCPIVQIMDLTDDPIDCAVGFSHVAAGYAMTTHLVEQGYKRIAFMSDWLNKRSLGRLDGYKQAVNEAGLYDEQLIISNPEAAKAKRPGETTTVALGRALTAELLARDPAPDAVFCNNDVMALGVLYECQSRGIDIPSEMGICGFNDLDQMQAVHPPISSLRTFRYDIGRRAVTAALALVEGTENVPKMQDVGFEVQARESTDRMGKLKIGL